MRPSSGIRTFLLNFIGIRIAKRIRNMVASCSRVVTPPFSIWKFL